MAGYVWLYFGITSAHSHSEMCMKGCLIKMLTGIPCPSCGTTRSIISLFNGELEKSILLNSLGLVVALIMIISPIWISYDLISKRSTFFNFYGWFEQKIRKPLIATPLVLLVLINWIWNIIKGL